MKKKTHSDVIMFELIYNLTILWFPIELTTMLDKKQLFRSIVEWNLPVAFEYAHVLHVL